MRAFLAALLLAAVLATPGPAAGPRPSRKTAEAFENSWHYYLWRIEQGGGLAELEDILVRIKTKYDGTGLNLAAVERELTAVRALRKPVAAQPVGGE